MWAAQGAAAMRAAGWALSGGRLRQEPINRWSFSWQRIGDLVRDTEGYGKGWGLQTFTPLGCEGIKAQGFLFWGPSLEAPARAVLLFFSYCTKIKPFEGSACLRLCYGKPRVRKPGLTVRWRCSCKGASVPAQVVGRGMQGWFLDGRGRVSLTLLIFCWKCFEQQLNNF